MSDPNGWEIAGKLIGTLLMSGLSISIFLLIIDNISHLSLRVKELEKKNGIPTKPYLWQIEKPQPTEGVNPAPHASSKESTNG